MTVRLVIIQNNDLASVSPVVEKLRNAVDAGNMKSMNDATGKLLSLTDGKQSVDISEAEWRKFTAKIRTKNPGFKADYILSGEFFSGYFSNMKPGTMVLQFPLTEG